MAIVSEVRRRLFRHDGSLYGIVVTREDESYCAIVHRGGEQVGSTQTSPRSAIDRNGGVDHWIEKAVIPAFKREF